MKSGTATRKRGRPPKSSDAHKARGNQARWVRAALIREGKCRPALHAVVPAKPALPRLYKKKLREYIRMLPGYDPWAHWGAGRYWFDEDEALRRIRFFHERYHHSKGEKAREPFILEPWQQGVIGNLFGWKVEGTNQRRFHEMLLYVPRKNGKTPLAGGILWCMLELDDEPGAEIYGAASEYRQASLVFEHMMGAYYQNPDWADRYTLYRGITQKAIQSKTDPLTVYRPVSSDAGVLHGFNAHGVVIDELHTQPNSELVDALLTSTGARRQPLVCHLTTADFERENSVCNAKHDYAHQVLDGRVIDPTFLPVVYEASKDDDWTDEAVWAKANPNIGVSIKVEYLRQACRRAQEVPSAQNIFKRLHLNIRTDQDVQFITLPDWDACRSDIDIETLKGRKCWCGLDLASKLDFSAFVMVFPIEDDEYVVLPHFWLPAGNLKRCQDTRPVNWIMEWIHQGHVEAIAGEVMDYSRIRRRINELGEMFNIREIAFDRWDATQTAVDLEADGFVAVQFGQGFKSYKDPTAELEKLIVCRKLRHDGNPVMRWMVGNMMVETDAAGSMKPSKKKSGGKIDGPVALIMGLSRAMVRVETTGAWADHGIEFAWGG